MKISIITATFNRAHVLGNAIQSVQEQTFANVEHVIQDGGSTDGTLDLIRNLCGDNAVVESGADEGIYDALNKAIARTSGDIIGVMHSDDIFASSRVLSLIANRFENPDVDGVFGDLDYVSSSQPNRIVRHWRSGSYQHSKLYRGWMPPHPTLFLRRSVLERLGAYDTTYKISGDYEAILRWLTRGGIRLAYIPEVLVKMRVGGESNRSIKHIFLKSKEDYRAIRLHKVGGFGTLLLKNFSKVTQFYTR